MRSLWKGTFCSLIKKALKIANKVIKMYIYNMEYVIMKKCLKEDVDKRECRFWERG